MSRSNLPTPTELWWAPRIPIQYVHVNRTKLRYIQTGQGPNLVLLHTLRTQLDIFHKVIPKLSESFTVHALDYPGHGYSDIPRTDYTPDFFTEYVEGFLEAREIEDATLVGVSIGASIALMLAARHNPRVSRVVAINPFDYLGGGVGRGNFVANVVFTSLKIPVLGSITLFFNNRAVERKLLEGGVADPSSMSRAFSDEVFSVGTRPGYSKAFLNLVSHVNSWDDIKESYPNIRTPVFLIYGESDWAKDAERAKTAELIPNVNVETVERGGHFLVLDQPERVLAMIDEF